MVDSQSQITSRELWDSLPRPDGLSGRMVSGFWLRQLLSFFPNLIFGMTACRPRFVTVTELAILLSKVAQLSGGLLLYCAGIGKLWSIGPAYLFGNIVLSRELHIAIGLVEIVVGVMAFVFSNSRAVRIAMLIAFLSFLSILAVKYLNGSKYCNCIPGIESPLFTMIIVDAMILLGIALSFFSHPNFDWQQIQVLRGLYIALGLSALILCFKFRSADQVFYALSGQTMTVDQSHKVVVAEGDVISIPFTLTNHGGKERRILGARSSCGCTSLEGLPASISGYNEFTTTMTIRNGESDSLNAARDYVSHFYCDGGTPITTQVTVVFLIKISGSIFGFVN